jgi:hypothetical protein
VKLTTSLYLASVDDKEFVDLFLLDQQMGPDPKLRTYLEVGLRFVLWTYQSKLVYSMRSSVQPIA